MEYKVEHLFYFGRRSLEGLLKEAGFEPLVCRESEGALARYIYYHFERFPVPVLTSLFRLVRRCVPEGLAHRHCVLPASGMFDRQQAGGQDRASASGSAKATALWSCRWTTSRVPSRKGRRSRFCAILWPWLRALVKYRNSRLYHLQPASQCVQRADEE